MGAHPQEGEAKLRTDIPADMVWPHGFDAFTAELGDPFAAISRLHEGPGLIWTADASYGRPGWIVTRHAIMAQVFMDHERFSAERPGMIADLLGVNLRLNPIEIDPPAHHHYRRILQPCFTPMAVKSIDASVREACNALIARFAEAGRCEFIHDFAIPFPSYVFLDLMGMPRDMVGDFIAWEDGLMRGKSMEARVAAARAIYGYLKGFLEQQKRRPVNDLMAAIVEGQFEGRPLTELEQMGMLYVLYVGGLDTVYSTLGWTMRHLAKHPELQTRLRANPASIPAAVEEFCRAFSVVVTHRQVTQDFMFHGAPLRKGEEINLPLALANRDASVFANPHSIDIDRKPRHLAFGTGAHTCLGIHVAKREIAIVLEAFLARFSAIRLRGDDFAYHTGRTFGVDRLPLELEPV